MKNIILIAALLVVLFVPEVKAVFLKGLLTTGIFAPDVNDKPSGAQVPNGDVLFKDGQNNLVSISSLKGKVIFINFWATWCPPCRAEMPSVDKLYRAYQNNPDLVFITVDADGNYQKSKKFLDRKGFKIPVYTLASNIPPEFFAGKLPTTIVLNKKGELAFKHEGMADYNDDVFRKFLNEQLQ